ncbi:AT-hook motif nuclear-localized protein 14 [Raphanus sativus]|nr:AT-hook motif nuclear-localized protein 14 [Raphanus sativus]
MEPNESHHQQQQQPTVNAVPSSNNGLFPPPQQQHQPNDGSSSHAVYNPHSVPSSAAVTEPLKRKRGRPRKYVTPEQALEAKKMASAASSSSAKERREQAAAAGGTTTTTSSNPGSSKKSQLGSVGRTGQSFTPHIVNIAPGEDVAQKIMMFAQQSKHELCVLSASGTISTASLRQSGGNISYEGQYEIISLSGSFIRAEQGGKTGGLSVSLSRSDGQIIGGAVGTHLIAAGPVQVILGTFQLDRKKDGVKGEASNSGSRLTSPSSPGPGPGPGPLLGMGFRSVMESPGRNPMRGNDEHHHHHQQTGMGGSHHFMMQAPQGMHMTHPRPSEWGGGGNSGHDGRDGGGVGYDLSGRLGHESSENGDYEQQIPD